MVVTIHKNVQKIASKINNQEHLSIACLVDKTLLRHEPSRKGHTATKQTF